MRAAVIVLIIMLVVLGCSSVKKNSAPTASNPVLDKMIIAQKFIINSDWASPMVTTSFNAIANSGLLPPGNTANNINLIGNTNYVKMIGDSIFGDLPYYGERRMSGAYGSSNSGISFEGIPQKLSITKDSLRQQYQIYFEIPDKNNPIENYQLRLTLYANLKSSMNINSSHKTPIRYSGSIGAIQLNEK